jgi:hypothetical protein
VAPGNEREPKVILVLGPPVHDRPVTERPDMVPLNRVSP